MAKQHHSLAEQQQRFSAFSDTIITSRNNPKIKQIRALLKHSERERTGLALIEGLHLVTEALHYPQLVRCMIVAPALLRSQHGQALLQDQWQNRLANYPSPMILLMGSERQGLSPQQQTLCDLVVSIPMRGSSDSLNVSIATAVVLYEILHRREG
jgi:tRNA G18 (ribose-2'-O)-methylase SpoU